VRADLVVVGRAHLTSRRVRVLVVEVECARDACKRPREHGNEREHLDEAETHVNPL
jgi:hypothetical protein